MSLTGNTRHRINWRGKVIMQVEYWERELRSPYCSGRWRDACAQDLVDIAQGRIKAERPMLGPPMPPSVRPLKPAPTRQQIEDTEKFWRDHFMGRIAR